MTNPEAAPYERHEAAGRPIRASPAQAARVRRPQACGCGRPVAFDLDKREFFCIGCAAAKECTCVRSWLTSQPRPVNVA